MQLSIPWRVFPAGSSGTSGYSGSLLQIHGSSGFLHLRLPQSPLWRSAVRLTPPSPLHTDSRLAGLCLSVSEQEVVDSPVCPERAAAVRCLNSSLTVQTDGQKLLLIGRCLSASHVIGQIQFRMSAGVMLRPFLSDGSVVKLVVCLLWERLCRGSPLDQRVAPPAGLAGYFHLWRKKTAQVRFYLSSCSSTFLIYLLYIYIYYMMCLL